MNADIKPHLFDRSNCVLLLLAIFQTVLYALLSVKSVSFAYDAPAVDRPILFVLGMLGVCFAAHLAGLWFALKSRNQQTTLYIIVFGSLAFRLAFLFSAPIQEVDIYRYAWDGAVARTGVSPFRYGPQRILTASTEETGWSPDLKTLVALRDSDEGLKQVLQRVHFGQLTTIYPPVSQVVFALSDVLTPRGSTLDSRILVMKSVIVGFDLATLAVLGWLLTLLRYRLGWLVAYGWSPLVLKEFSNSGHLDAIAVFCVVAALVAFAKSNLSARELSTESAFHSRSKYWRYIAALMLGLGTGAKLFPIILFPLLAIVTFVRFGVWEATKFCAVAMVVSCLVLLPMIVAIRNPPPDRFSALQTADDNVPPPPSYTSVSEAQAAEHRRRSLRRSTANSENAVSNSGLATFLSRWEMNDLLFMLLEENLRAPLATSAPYRDPWFVVLPVEYRRSITGPATRILGIPESRVPFALTRFVSLLIFAVVSIVLAIRASRSEDIADVAEAAFLTIAWFWLLSPTQNPWYWTWALPLIPFARGRLWLVLSGLVLLYYARFWLQYHYSNVDVLSSGLTGTRFFDLIVVWFEFGPFLVGLLSLAALRRWRSLRP